MRGRQCDYIRTAGTSLFDGGYSLETTRRQHLRRHRGYLSRQGKHIIHIITSDGGVLHVCTCKFFVSPVDLLPGTKKRKHEDQLTLYAANAGDARIVLGHRGRAKRLTKDHRPDDPEEVARIEKAGGFMFKGRVVGVLAITRSLGDHCMKTYVVAEPYCSETTIQLDQRDDGNASGRSAPPPSFLICACDGLWDVFEDQEAVDFCLKYYEHEKENIAEHLVNEAIRKGSTDNVTAVVAWL